MLGSGVAGVTAAWSAGSGCAGAGALTLALVRAGAGAGAATGAGAGAGARAGAEAAGAAGAGAGTGAGAGAGARGSGGGTASDSFGFPRSPISLHTASTLFSNAAASSPSASQNGSEQQPPPHGSIRPRSKGQSQDDRPCKDLHHSRVPRIKPSQPLGLKFDCTISGIMSQSFCMPCEFNASDKIAVSEQRSCTIKCLVVMTYVVSLQPCTHAERHKTWCCQTCLQNHY